MDGVLQILGSAVLLVLVFGMGWGFGVYFSNERVNRMLEDHAERNRNRAAAVKPHWTEDPRTRT